MKKLFAIVSIAAPAALVLSILGGASPAREPDANATISALLDYDASDCVTNCEIDYCIQFGGGHNNHHLPGGNDTGRLHLCRGAATCFEHACFWSLTLAPHELVTVVDLVSRLSAGELVALQEAEANLSLNRDRNALQVLGCQGKALASIKLTSGQKAVLDLIE